MGVVLHLPTADYWKTAEINYSFSQSIFGKVLFGSKLLPEY